MKGTGGDVARLMSGLLLETGWAENQRGPRAIFFILLFSTHREGVASALPHMALSAVLGTRKL